MRALKLLGRDHTFAVLRGLANPPGATVTFGALHAAVGCSGRMVMDTVRACVAKGWVTLVGPRAGWRLSIEGEAVLRLAEQLEARDGEPSLPADQFELLGPYRVSDELATAWDAGFAIGHAAGTGRGYVDPEFSTDNPHRDVDTSESAPNEEPLDF